MEEIKGVKTFYWKQHGRREDESTIYTTYPDFSEFTEERNYEPESTRDLELVCGFFWTRGKNKGPLDIIIKDYLVEHQHKFHYKGRGRNTESELAEWQTAFIDAHGGINELYELCKKKAEELKAQEVERAAKAAEKVAKKAEEKKEKKSEKVELSDEGSEEEPKKKILDIEDLEL